MDYDLKELARYDMFKAMEQEMIRNEELIRLTVINRRSPREIKESVFYAMARNNSIKHFLELSEQKPENLLDYVPVSEDFKNLMLKVGAKRYPLEIKRNAERSLYGDYTHVDYKRQIHLLDQELPEKPRFSVMIEKIGNTIGIIIAGAFSIWWVFLIVFLVWANYLSENKPNHLTVSTSGHNNTFGQGGIYRGNSILKSVSDQDQVEDGSAQSGFGNGGKSGQDSSSSSQQNATSSIGGNSIKIPSNKSISNVSTNSVTHNPISTKDVDAKINPKSQPEVFEAKDGFFGIGSTMDEVIFIMGEPESKTITIFNYDFSSVYFSNNKVSGWSNIGNTLKVFIGDKVDNTKSFTLGSSRKQVINAAGTPTTYQRNSFSYGFSSVYFDDNGRIKGWSIIGNDHFNVKLGEKVEGAMPFSIGSTIEDVVAVMGTPDSYNSQGLGYDFSTVYIVDGKVSKVSNISNNLKYK
ncbi:hypothetical protein [Paenibacillus pini]|uniref:Uncharacterized protein n=1 Tax=Paenibacillus pini JCM 16418 TaxID=1236976 RepID=W7YIU6_9BACL|nr:hypothetical protein [Paenibacillus pini]GAF10820.1 hypothetical protein JCM16418_5044 [Paenibacillus pini JCM 16418]